MYWLNIRSLHVDQRVSMEARIKASADTYIQLYFALRFDGSNLIMFYVNETGGTPDNILIQCENGGALTSQSTGITQDALYHIYRIECHTHGGNHAHFYIDGTETANSPITTNIPDDATDYLQPYLRVLTQEDAAKSIDIDYCVVRQDV